jgi:hypothetical protein
MHTQHAEGFSYWFCTTKVAGGTLPTICGRNNREIPNGEKDAREVMRVVELQRKRRAEQRERMAA